MHNVLCTMSCSSIDCIVYKFLVPKLTIYCIKINLLPCNNTFKMAEIEVFNSVKQTK